MKKHVCITKINEYYYATKYTSDFLFRVIITGTENGIYFLDWDMSATCELLRGRDFNTYYVLELAVSLEVAVVRPIILSMSVCLQTCVLLGMYPFYWGQVMDRCACSGSSSWIPFMTCLWPICGKERILDNLPVKRSGADTKMCVWKYSRRNSSSLVIKNFRSFLTKDYNSS